MRLLAMAGAAARRNNVAIYNCSYQPVESIDDALHRQLRRVALRDRAGDVDDATLGQEPRHRFALPRRLEQHQLHRRGMAGEDGEVEPEARLADAEGQRVTGQHDHRPAAPIDEPGRARGAVSGR